MSRVGGGLKKGTWRFTDPTYGHDTTLCTDHPNCLLVDGQHRPIRPSGMPRPLSRARGGC